MIREALKNQMKLRKINISQLAKSAGLSRPGLSAYLAGKKDLVGKSLEKIFLVLKLSLS